MKTVADDLAYLEGAIAHLEGEVRTLKKLKSALERGDEKARVEILKQSRVRS